MASIQVPPEWEKLNPADLAGTIVVIGQTDSGKSTCVRRLVGWLSEHHARVGWLDADVGQSTLGVPTTMNLAVVSGPLPQTPHPDATFFVGATSPKATCCRPSWTRTNSSSGRTRWMLTPLWWTPPGRNAEQIAGLRVGSMQLDPGTGEELRGTRGN